MFHFPIKFFSTLFVIVVLAACSSSNSGLDSLSNDDSKKTDQSSGGEQNHANNDSPDIDEFPLSLAVYGRDDKDLCSIAISGGFNDDFYSSAILSVARDGLEYSEDQITIDTSSTESSRFYFEPEIEAGLYSYDVTLSVSKDDGASKVITRASDIVCGDIYLINGQSNALAHERYNETNASGLVTPWLRTFGTSASATTFGWFIADDSSKEYEEPVGQWGMHLGNTISEQQEVPIAIFNGAVGGSRILEHQRNDLSPTDSSGIYGRLLARTVEAGVNQHIKAILWHQGESDQGQEDLYLEAFNELYYDWAEDYPNVSQIYLFQIRQGCNNYGRLKEIQRGIPQLFSDVTIMSTTSVPGYDGCHYYYDGYEEFSKRIYRLIDRDIYGALDSPNIEAPNIIDARQLSKRRILLTFHDPDATFHFEPGAVDDFYLSDKTKVISAVTKDNQIYLTLEKPTNAGRISYVGRSPEGAWVTNANGVGILAFYRHRIRQ